MLAINERRVASPRVTYVNADIFAWQPDRAYDTVFFGTWLSHVPPAAFDGFWALVRTCLVPNGRVAFVDEDDRASGLDDRYSLDDSPPPAEPSATAASSTSSKSSGTPKTSSIASAPPDGTSPSNASTRPSCTEPAVTESDRSDRRPKT